MCSAANYAKARARRMRMVEEAEQTIIDGKWPYSKEAIQFVIGKMATSKIEFEDALDIWATSEEINLKDKDYEEFKETINLLLPFKRYEAISVLCHLIKE